MEYIFDKQDTFGDVLRMYRNMRKMTKAELAEKAGVSLGSISKYERAGYDDGQYPPLPKFAKLVCVLNADVGQLLRFLGETEEERFRLGPIPGEEIDLVVEKTEQNFELLKSISERLEALEARAEEKKNSGSLATAPSSLDDNH